MKLNNLQMPRFKSVKVLHSGAEVSYFDAMSALRAYSAAVRVYHWQVGSHVEAQLLRMAGNDEAANAVASTSLWASISVGISKQHALPEGTSPQRSSAG